MNPSFLIPPSTGGLRDLVGACPISQDVPVLLSPPNPVMFSVLEFTDVTVPRASRIPRAGSEPALSVLLRSRRRRFRSLSAASTLDLVGRQRGEPPVA
jgi:hypothetical protein